MSARKRASSVKSWWFYALEAHKTTNFLLEKAVQEQRHPQSDF